MASMTDSTTGRRRRHPLLWPTGVDPAMLGDGHARLRYCAAGALIYLTATAAFASMILAQIVIFGPFRLGYLVAATIWSLVVLSIDIWITSTIDYGPLEPDEPKKSKGKILAFVGRFVMSTVIGILIAEPILLMAFDQEVTVAVNKIHDQQAEGITQQVADRAEFRQREADIDRAFGVTAPGVPPDPASATSKHDKAIHDDADAYNQWRCEYLGTCGSMVAGRGSQEGKAWDTYQSAHAALPDAEKAYAEAQNTYNIDKGKLNTDIQDAVQRETRNIDDNRGLLIREQALEQVESGSWRAWFGSQLVRGALLLMDLMPLLIKTFSPRSLYERQMRANAIREYYGIESEAREEALHRATQARIRRATELTDARSRNAVAQAAALTVAEATRRSTIAQNRHPGVSRLADEHITDAVHRLAPRPAAPRARPGRTSKNNVPSFHHAAPAPTAVPPMRFPADPQRFGPETGADLPADRDGDSNDPSAMKSGTILDSPETEDSVLSNGHTGNADPEDEPEPAQGQFPFVLGNRWLVEGWLLPGRDRRNGAAKLYRARDTSGEYDFEAVVKVYPGATGDLRDAARKEAEFRGIEHTNLAKIYDAKSDRTDFYLVTERFPHTLQTFVDRQPLTLIQTWDFTNQVLKGLVHAWAHNKLHLDIKPSNIAVDKNRVLKIFDWGISKDSDRATGHTSAGPSYTRHYAPPEQIERSRGWLSKDADLRALAATWYWMLTGNPPLQLEAIDQRVVGDDGRIANEKAYVKFLRKCPPAPVRQVIPEIPQEIDDLLLRWLDPTPRKRNLGPKKSYDTRLFEQLDRIEEIINDSGVGRNLVGPMGRRDARQRPSHVTRTPSVLPLPALSGEEPTHQSRRSDNGSEGPHTSPN